MIRITESRPLSLRSKLKSFVLRDSGKISQTQMILRTYEQFINLVGLSRIINK